MKYLISSDLAEIQAIESRIHQWMINNVSNYNATKWSDIFKHPTLDLYMIPVKDTDPRRPFNVLRTTEKTRSIESIDETWRIKTDFGTRLQKYEGK